MRADARHNRDRIVAAGRELMLERGVEAPLDQIAARAGVGNATLYRHFPTRADLVRRVVLHDMERVRAEAAAALDAEPTGWAALRRFCTVVVEERLVALLPIAGPHLVRDAEFAAVRDGLVAALDALLAAARADGSLRADVEAGDVVLTLAAVMRPLPGLPAALVEAMQARHLGLVLDGLRAQAASPLPGAPVSADDITARLAAGQEPG
ncbi:MAG TPA: helix-turn-helix domain-containing protein [Pseudonocardia sp.]|uniref:TetR/AcrR family transcriptional regulator n=1 Tax=Pseudonocardia sp. TaxID=60912 RepID=UPI002B4AD9CD|nr:helix-turn-helix domain-containing protein [Pseudonocardia sp.]HLU60417.1 helix-turn-helix domain-containing protein [Pseudonocardia sp.]